MNWNAVAAIGTCLGALASFLTVLFAILSNRKSNKLMSGQISAMIKQLAYLSEQNHIASESIKEAKKQTDIAKQTLNTQISEIQHNRYNVSEIKIQDMKEFLTLIEVQNKLIGMMYKEISEKSSKEEKTNAD